MARLRQTHLVGLEPAASRGPQDALINQLGLAGVLQAMEIGRGSSDHDPCVCQVSDLNSPHEVAMGYQDDPRASWPRAALAQEPAQSS